ncbi:MAG: hypothetical protein QXV37_04115 [Candidatus Jordarchaeaceae archaeon]
MSFIEEPHSTRSMQRFRLLSLNCDKITQFVLDAVNSYKGSRLNRPELFNYIRDHQPVDTSNFDKEFIEELENGAAILYARGKYRINMNRLLMLMKLFIKEIERRDKDRADMLKQKIEQIELRIKNITGETGAPGLIAKPKLPEYEEIEKEEPTAEIKEIEYKKTLDPIDAALSSYIKEYSKLSIPQISSVLGISEEDVKQRLNYMLKQGLIIGKIQGEYLIQEAVIPVPTLTTSTKIEKTIKTTTPPTTLETTPKEEATITEPITETTKIVEKPVTVKPTVTEKPATITPTVTEKPVVVPPLKEHLVTEEATVKPPKVETEVQPPLEVVTYTVKDVKKVYERLKLFIEMVSQVLEMVAVPEKPGFTMKDLSKLIYDYYFLPIDGSFDVEPFKELSEDGAVLVEKDWIRIDLEKSLALFKNRYIPGIRNVKKKMADKLEKALKEHIETPIENILSRAGA